MLSPHLILQVEQHAEALAAALADELGRDPRTPAYRHVARAELIAHVQDTYAHLGDWLAGRTDGEVEARFGPQGRDRFNEGVPLEQMVWAIVLARRQLHAYLRQTTEVSSAAEMHSVTQVEELASRFFDRVLFAQVSGYEAARREGPHRQTSRVLGAMQPGNIGWVP